MVYSTHSLAIVPIICTPLVCHTSVVTVYLPPSQLLKGIPVKNLEKCLGKRERGWGDTRKWV